MVSDSMHNTSSNLGTSSIVLRHTKDWSVSSNIISLWWLTGLFSAKICTARFREFDIPFETNLRSKAFSTFSSRSPFWILFSNSIKLLLPCCLTTSINSTILNLLRKSRLRILLTDELVLHTGSPLTEGNKGKSPQTSSGSSLKHAE